MESPLKDVVGGNSAAILEKAFGFVTTGELLRHYPRRYAQRGELTKIRDLADGDHVTIVADVVQAVRRPMKTRKGLIFEVVVSDGTDAMQLTFFNQVPRHFRVLRKGRRGLFTGKVSTYKRARQLAHPQYRMLDEDSDEFALDFASELIPIYPTTREVATWQVGKAARHALEMLDPLDDPLPETIRAREALPTLNEALQLIHTPSNHGDVQRARRRLKWDEAIALQAALAQRRAAARALPATPRAERDDGLLVAFDARLPFELTEGQRDVSEVISQELADIHPMHRLLQGEVGSGKTVVALRAMLTVVDNGGQAALLAPTEVLANQHFRAIRELLGPLAAAGELGSDEQATRVALLTGAQGAVARRCALEEVASGSAGLVVGTHALLEEGVVFHDLGLVVVDEQHRFGVEQRDALRAKGTAPHLLVMTATPIPRTVAMTVYGDLDVSTLTELPKGRSPIATHVVDAAERPNHVERAWERVCEEVAAGHQVYVVCPRIGGESSDDDTLETEDDARAPIAVLDTFPMLRDGPLAGLRVEVLHGRLPSDVKDDAMRRFARGDVDVLVATTVIEVGVDVPNATMMVVLDADRFGVSQLHQLRGRVGRGNAPGLCLLVTEQPSASPARERLDAVAATLDGFELSQLDLQQRREGDVLGVAQAGRRRQLRLLGLLEDEDVIRAAREAATELVDADPELHAHPGLARAVADLVGDERAEYLEKA